MPTRDAFIDNCRSILEQKWEKVTSGLIAPSADLALYQPVIKRCINSGTKTYRYVLPTQLLAKLASHSLDCRSVQVAYGGSGAFDARSVCHKIIVKFDKDNENVLGGSPEPYVNNPLRVPGITSQYLQQQKDKAGWNDLCLVLEKVEHRNDRSFTQSAFEQVLVEIYDRLSKVRFTYPVPNRVGLEQAQKLVRSFLSAPSGGDRALAIASALFETIGVRFNLYEEVHRFKITAANAATGQIADIECLDSGNSVVLAIEVKDKELTVGHIKGKMDEARSRGVSEMLFLAEKGISEEETEEIDKLTAREFSSGQNIYISDLQSLISSVFVLLGEEGRRDFLASVGKVLNRFSAVEHRRAWAELLSKI